MIALDWSNPAEVQEIAMKAGLLALVSAFEDCVLVVSDEVPEEDAKKINHDLLMMRGLLEQTCDLDLLDKLIGGHYTHPQHR